MEPYTSYLGKRLKLAIAVALTATLLLSGAGCAKDVNPPVIQQAEMPEWAVEGENVELSVSTTDDRGVKEVYVQFDSGDKITLTKVDSQKDGEEIANWKASFKLSPKDYSYSIVAKDTANEAGKEGKIAVYPFDSDGDGIGYRDEIKYGLDPNKPNLVTKYLLDNNLGIYIPILSYLDKDGVMDVNEKVFVDLIDDYKGVDNIYPGFVAELAKLPDLAVIDEKDDEAVEKILKLASDPQYKKSFESMLNEGIPDKRKFCTPLQATMWLAYDRDLENYSSLKYYSLEGLIRAAWTNTTTSRNYKSDRWQEYYEVVDRLNSGNLVSMYIKDNILYVPDMVLYGVFNYWAPARQLFEKKKGDCEDVTAFGVFCLKKNGIQSAWLDIEAPEFQSFGGHMVIVYIKNGFYSIDTSLLTMGQKKGPFNTVDDVVKSISPSYTNWSAPPLTSY